MFTTPEKVMAVTPYEDITLEDVRQAQFVIEMYIGRTEADIKNPRDAAILARATAAQAVYMKDRPDITFNQIKTGTHSRGEEAVSFRDEFSPFVAPLAALACEYLSFWNSRSIKVGRSFQKRVASPLRRWATE